MISGTINTPFSNKRLRLLLKQLFEFTNARNQFLYFFNLLFSPFVNLWLPFCLLIAHSTIAFTKSSLAETSNARLTCGLAPYGRVESVVVTSTASLPCAGGKTSIISPGKIFVLNLSWTLIDCV